LVALGAAAGTTIRVSAGGPDAEQALAAVRELVGNRFGEPPAEQ
jgi:phosphocarrier protein